MDGIADRADRSREKPVRDLPYIRESVVRDETSAAAAGKYCAYNQTRECFLCSDIESGDFPPAALDARLRSLAPGFTTALWLTPFRGISATSVRIPLDLIYLDPNFVVLDVVESFPISSPSSGAPATSVLALPANTIADAGTRVGDRLILCPPGEMKRRVQQLLATPSEGRAEPIGASGADPNNRGAAGRVLRFVDRAKPNSSPESSPETAPLEIVPAQMPPAEEPELAPPAQTPVPVQEKPKTKGWLQKLLNPDPPQPRKAQRDLAQGLVAFYFTGGDSAPHAVRDIRLDRALSDDRRALVSGNGDPHDAYRSAQSERRKLHHGLRQRCPLGKRWRGIGVRIRRRAQRAQQLHCGAGWREQGADGVIYSSNQERRAIVFLLERIKRTNIKR